jgi:hypothetical protein
VVNDIPGPYLRQFNPTAAYKHLGVETAAVLFYGGGRQVVVWPGGRGERPPMMRRPFAVCEVALGRHNSSFEMELPARGGAAFFQTEVDLLWEVENPSLVAQAQLRDVRMLRPELVQLLQDVTMRFPINQAEAAYLAVKSALENGLGRQVGAPVGLLTTVFVRLRLNEATMNHAAAVAEIEHDRVVNERRQQLDAERKDFEDAQLAKRAARFATMLGQGELAQVAMLAAQDSANLPQVVSAMMKERRHDHTETIEFVKHMIDRGYLQPHQLDEPTRALLTYTMHGGDPGRLQGGPPMAIGQPLQRRALERSRSEEDGGNGREPRGRGSSRPPEPWDEETDSRPNPSRPDDPPQPPGHGGRYDDDRADRRDEYSPPAAAPPSPTYELYGPMPTDRYANEPYRGNEQNGSGDGYGAGGHGQDGGEGGYGRSRDGGGGSERHDRGGDRGDRDGRGQDRYGDGAARSGDWSASHDWEQS